MTEHFSGGDEKTAAKLVIHDEYLSSYTSILDKHWETGLWYIDTHAGTGKTRVTDTGPTLDGSTIQAIKHYAGSFDRFYFYEHDDDHFQLLHETLADSFDIEFTVSPVKSDAHDFPVARCEDPHIRVMQTDSEEGVDVLAEKASPHPHWFVFIDPIGLVNRSTLTTLLDRGNVDILLTYQTSSVARNAAADHSQAALTQSMGDSDWPRSASRDDFVQLYTEKLETNPAIRPVLTKKLVSPHDKRCRFDLVFACKNDGARNAMRWIMQQDTLWTKAVNRLGQARLTDFSKTDQPTQTSLDEFL